MIKNQRKRYITTLAAGAMLVAGAAPAMAEAVACTASIIKLGNENCTTGTIPPNASGHFIHISIVGANAHWEAWDQRTNVLVGSGQTSVLGLERTIFGLYAPSRYYVVLGSFVGARVTLNNT